MFLKGGEGVLATKVSYGYTYMGICTSCGTVNKTITEEEIMALISLVRIGDKKAKEELILQYCLFVRKLAYRFTEDKKDYYDDFIQEANIALLEAAELYDPSKGASFTYFAGICICRRILRYKKCNTTSVVHVPKRAQDRLGRLIGEYERFYQENGRCPTDEELTTILKIPLSAIKQAREDASSSAPYIEFNDLCACFLSTEDDIEDLFIAKEKIETVIKVVSDLNENNKEVFCYFYGIYLEGEFYYFGPRLTLKEISVLLQTPYDTLKSRLDAARNTIRLDSRILALRDEPTKSHINKPYSKKA